MMEAAAAGLRLIAPEHSGYRAYLDNSIARMIPVRRVPAAPADRARREHWFEDAEWWVPDEDVAARAVGEAVAGRSRDWPTARARLSAFTRQSAAARLITILEELHARRGRRF